MSVVHRILGESDHPHDNPHLSSPEYAYDHAVDMMARWPEGEPIIAKSPVWSYQYARDVVKGRWPEGEPAILTDPEIAYWYARRVLKSRWPEAEPMLIKIPYIAALYSARVMNERWHEAEPAIASSNNRRRYLEFFPSAASDWASYGWDDWLET